MQKVKKPRTSMLPVKIMLTPYAYWHLHWMCQQTPNEVSSMGLLNKDGPGLVIKDFILVKQAVTPGTVDLDMEWWAEKQVQLYDERGIEPWQTSVWCHTHPAGVDGPSMTDEETMHESFGNWDFVVMLILTKADVFHARLEFDHCFGNATKQRIRLPIKVCVDWSAAPETAINKATLEAWEAEYKELVQEEAIPLFSAPSKSWWAQRCREQHTKPVIDPITDDPHLYEQEENAYEQYREACQSQGLDPEDPELFQSFFGYEVGG